MNRTTYTRILTGILPAAVALAFWVAGSTYDAPIGSDWVAGPGAHPANQTPNYPRFGNTDAATHPGAVPLAKLHGAVPSKLVVSDREGITRVYAYTDANAAKIKASGDNGPTADDLYVVGAIR